MSNLIEPSHVKNRPEERYSDVSSCQCGQADKETGNFTMFYRTSAVTFSLNLLSRKEKTSPSTEETTSEAPEKAAVSYKEDEDI